MKDIELYNDSFQNYKGYQIPKAQLILTDVPYNLGNNAYASNPIWYEGGDNKNGESAKAGKKFFSSENEFRPAEFMHFCSKMLIKEPKGTGKAPCMIMFCEFEQQFQFIELGRKYGLNKYINLVFRKNYSPQVLKANMKIVGNCEYGVLYYLFDSGRVSRIGTSRWKLQRLLPRMVSAYSDWTYSTLCALQKLIVADWLIYRIWQITTGYLFQIGIIGSAWPM